ncbi:HAMP domain-containing sensor histidine kinase [uncultured Croceitalea sp.]|uniref:sensor histidine kinase n=1 Tax=uncultured Croceitalea sp. TaxID=1798908 RepID=UPI0033064148
MHSLLKRQLKKYLPRHLKDERGIDVFLDTISNSYNNYDEKLHMLQRATAISSEELFIANRAIEKEATRQKQILDSLEEAITSLKSNLKQESDFEYDLKDEFDASKLAKHITGLANKVADMASEKNVLLKNLETQNDSLNNYAHIVSHDLKSPIRNINALMTWIMEDEKEKFSAISKNNAMLILENLEKMDKLINGILRHATIDSTEEHKTTFELRDMLQVIEKTIYVPDNVTIRYGINLPKITIERNKLEQMFMNLILNAITATEHLKDGLIVIKFIKNKDFWEFSISDNGKGIPLEHQKSIFNMFKKLDTNNSATGIGLALVKKIVNFYKGKINLESEENKGTTFNIQLSKVA